MEMAEYLANELGLNEDERKSLSRTIGWIIKNHGLIRKASHIKRGTKGNRRYIIEKTIFSDMLRRFQHNLLLDKLSEPILRNGKNGKSSAVSEVSTVSERTFQKDQLVFLPCNIPNCKNDKCNMLDGKPICNTHWHKNGVLKLQTPLKNETPERPNVKEGKLGDHIDY